MNAYALKLNPDANLLKQWDFGLVKDLLDCEIIEVTELPKIERAVVCIAARHHKGLELDINAELRHAKRVVLFLCGDEEADFNIELIDHPNIEIWVQNAHPDKHQEYNRIGTGYPQHMKASLPEQQQKTKTMMFAGQMTHKRRNELVNILRDMRLDDSSILCQATRGFTQGDEPKVYYNNLSQAKIAPAPSGAVVPDSFRLFEALECMAIPIADEVSPHKTYQGYWDFIFNEVTPFPKITEWDRLFGLVPELLDDYPRNLHQITAWYIQWKRNTKLKIQAQYEQ